MARRDLVARVLGVQVTGQLHDPLVVPISLTWCALLQCPRDSGFSANVVVAAGSGILGELVQIPLVALEREAACPPRFEPCIDACHEHGVPPIQGCATQRRSSTSTLA